VRVSDGATSWVQTLKLQEGAQANFMGNVVGDDGQSKREMIVNAVLAAGKPPPGLQYQIEVSGGRGSQLPMVQGQSDILLPPGARLTVLQCGNWTVEMSLDGGSAKAAPGPGSNYRVTGDVIGSKGKVRCRHLVRPGSQANSVDAGTRGGKKFGLILNTVAAASAKGVGLQYQLEYTAPG
jgi:hypothetical protein